MNMYIKVSSTVTQSWHLIKLAIILLLPSGIAYSHGTNSTVSEPTLFSNH